MEIVKSTVEQEVSALIDAARKQAARLKKANMILLILKKGV